MMRLLLAPALGAILLGWGCAERQSSPTSQEPSRTQAAGGVQAASADVQPASEGGEGGRRAESAPGEPDSENKGYNTGDSKEWPSYRFPLEIEIEVPEVPERIAGPSPEIPGEEEQPGSVDRGEPPLLQSAR